MKTESKRQAAQYAIDFTNDIPRFTIYLENNPQTVDEATVKLFTTKLTELLVAEHFEDNFNIKSEIDLTIKNASQGFKDSGTDIINELGHFHVKTFLFKTHQGRLDGKAFLLVINDDLPFLKDDDIFILVDQKSARLDDIAIVGMYRWADIEGLHHKPWKKEWEKRKVQIDYKDILAKKIPQWTGPVPF
jgi:hypothetical protein